MTDAIEILTALDIEHLVQQLGYEVCGIAASAPEAVQTADDLRPDLVLMDIRLARGTDSIQAAGEIRTRFDIASLYLSAHTDAATLNRAQATRPLGSSPSPTPRPSWRPPCRPPLQCCGAGQSNSHSPPKDVMIINYERIGSPQSLQADWIKYILTIWWLS